MNTSWFILVFSSSQLRCPGQANFDKYRHFFLEKLELFNNLDHLKIASRRLFILVPVVEYMYRVIIGNA